MWHVAVPVELLLVINWTMKRKRRRRLYNIRWKLWKKLDNCTQEVRRKLEASAPTVREMYYEKTKLLRVNTPDTEKVQIDG